MDSVNPRTQPVDDLRADLAESRAVKTQTSEQVVEESLQVQAQKAVPAIDQMRVASTELAQSWTGIVAAQDGSVQAPEEVDWSAWERAERGLPPEEPAVAATTVARDVDAGAVQTAETSEGSPIAAQSPAPSAPDESLSPQLEEVKVQLSSIKMVPNLSEEDIQRLTAGKKTSGEFTTIKVAGAAQADAARLATSPGVVKDGVVSMAAAEPTAAAIPKEIPATLGSVAEYRRYEEYLKSVKGEMDTIFEQEYNYEPEAMPARGIRFNPRESVEAARDQILADFVDQETGLTYREIEKIQSSMAGWETQLLNRERPQTAAYGLNARDRELQANPELAGMQARFQAHMASMPALTERGESESGTFELVRPASEDELKAYAATLVDPATGVSGSDLFHLDRSIQEKRQGDLAMNKLEFHKVGSFTGDQRVSDIDASRVFGVIGRDQRAQLMAEMSPSPMGEGFLLQPEGNLLLPSHRDPSGPWFLSAWSASDLAATGVINTGHGGYNLEGLAMNGSAHIGTVRPSGGIFGGLLNSVARILPGGKLGELVGDAVSDINQAINQPASSFLRFMGEDKDDFMTQVIGHQEATTNVLANAGETRGDTFATLVRDTAEYAQVTLVANTVGNALIATGVGAAIGAAIVVGTGAMLAGYQQLQGDKDADGNQGIGQALTSFAVGAVTAGIGNGVTSALGTASSTTAAGVTTTTVAANTASTFVSSTVNSVVTQAITSGEVDLEDALVAGALGAVGLRTQIAPGVNAVTLYNAGEALIDGDASAIASLGTNLVTGLSGARSIYSEIQNRGLTTTAPGEGDARDPLADDSTAAGPQSAGGPEAPEAIAAGPTLDNAARDIRRIDNANGDQVVQQSDGSWVTIAPPNPGVPGSQPQVARWERVDADGRTVVTHYGPEGNALSHRVTLPGGVIIEQPEGSNRLAITAGTQAEAFAAARSQGLAVFEYEGQPFHTLRADEIAAAERNLISANPELSRLSPTELRQLVLNATSAHALNVFRNSTMANAPGLDAGTIGAGVNLAASRQETDRPTDDSKSSGTPPGAPGVPGSADSTRTFSITSQEVENISRARDRELGPLPQASTVRTWDQATDQIARIQQRYPQLTPDQFDMALRSAYYSNPDNSQRNGFPVFDALLGSNYSDPVFMAAVRDIRFNLPQQFEGPTGRPLDMSHAWVGVNALNNGSNGTALLLTHGGDLGQVFGQALLNRYNGFEAGVNALAATGSPIAAVMIGLATFRAGQDPWSWAPPSQMEANSMGWQLGRLRAQTSDIVEAMRRVARDSRP